jgi:hypothetical protein
MQFFTGTCCDNTCSLHCYPSDKGVQLFPFPHKTDGQSTCFSLAGPRQRNHLLRFGFMAKLFCTTVYCIISSHVFSVLSICFLCLRFGVFMVPKMQVVGCISGFDAVYTGSLLPAFWKTILHEQGRRKYHC